MTKEQIWDAIDNGIEVNWENGLYYVHPVSVEPSNQYADVSRRGQEALRITCKSNYFGGLMTERCFDKCFIKET
jgi:hypothetical protein